MGTRPSPRCGSSPTASASRADRLDLHLGALSGGERRRAELVRILFGGSELLLLDEPTNHLDADARTWLLKFLRSYRGALLVVSHDLDLLDEAITASCTSTASPRRAPARSSSTRARTRSTSWPAKRRGAHARSWPSARRREIARLKVQADGMRGQTAKRARVAKNLDGRRAAPRGRRGSQSTSKRRALAVRFPEPPSAGRTVLTATELWKSFGALDVFSDVSFDVGRGERLLVMGLNGAGKTTLLKVLADAAQPRPRRGRARDPRVGRATTRRSTKASSPGRTLLEHMREASPAGDGALRNLLGMFGLSGEKVFQDADTLSGGEKTKLALAQLVAGRHNLLLLDEPTNNLDPSSRTATGEALAAWPGTMIVVSHDVEFVRSLAPDRALLMPDGTLDYFDDDMLDLVELV